MTRKIVQYAILEEEGRTVGDVAILMQASVDKLLANGWEPLGGPSMTLTTTPYWPYKMVQAVVKYQEPWQKEDADRMLARAKKHFPQIVRGRKLLMEREDTKITNDELAKANGLSVGQVSRLIRWWQTYQQTYRHRPAIKKAFEEFLNSHRLPIDIAN